MTLRSWGARLALLSGGLVPLTSCSGAPRVGAGAPSRPVVAPSVAATGPRIACVPTGPERCFDARDDNCNGLIDEGCGVHTGPVQFVVAWDASGDVDLLVTDPKGELAEVGRPTSLGLVKQRDCPGPRGECQGRNVENVYLDAADPKRGVYRVRVRLERLGEAEPPVRATLGVRVGPRTETLELELNHAEDERALAFEL